MKYTIDIPKPCNEKWSNMSPTEKGMYCSNCRKEVLDFTHFSNYELAKRIKNDNHLICGRFLHSQINAELNYSKANPIQKILSILGFSSLFITTPSFSQITKPNIVVVEKDYREVTSKPDNYIEISGTVRDQTGPLAGTTVVEVSTKNKSYVQTDKDGNFVIKIPIEKFEEKVFLRFQFIGMETIEKEVFKNQQKLNIQLVESDMLLGMVVVVKKHNFFARIGNWFKKEFNSGKCTR